MDKNDAKKIHQALDEFLTHHFMSEKTALTLINLPEVPVRKFSDFDRRQLCLTHHDGPVILTSYEEGFNCPEPKKRKRKPKKIYTLEEIEELASIAV